MDAKMSCQLKGLAGVIFGGLALVVPGPLIAFFTDMFWIFLVAGMALCILIAITSSTDESFFWFLCAMGLLVIGIIEVIFPSSLSFIFVLAIAVLAFYAGYTGTACALTRRQTRVYLIGGVGAASVILLYIFLTYMPAMRSYLVMTIVGTISLVLGLFALLMGLTVKNGEEVPPSPRTLILNTCRLTINPAKKPEEKPEETTPK